MADFSQNFTQLFDFDQTNLEDQFFTTNFSEIDIDPLLFSTSENKFPSEEDFQVDVNDELISSPLNDNFLNFNDQQVEKKQLEEPKIKEEQLENKKQEQKEKEQEKEQGQVQEQNERKRTPIRRGVVIIKKKKKKKAKNYIVGNNTHYLRNKETLKTLACRGLSLKPQEKKRRTMERNRINARTSRMRKKQYLNNLENQTKELKKHNNHLTKQLYSSHEENNSLRVEIQKLRELLNFKQSSSLESALSTTTSTTTKAKKTKTKTKTKSKSKSMRSSTLQTIEQASEQTQMNNDFSSFNQTDSVEVSISNTSPQNTNNSESGDDDDEEEEESESAFCAIIYTSQGYTKLSICGNDLFTILLFLQMREKKNYLLLKNYYQKQYIYQFCLFLQLIPFTFYIYHLFLQKFQNFFKNIHYKNRFVPKSLAYVS
ncbi:basic-leucine zipper transcription factor f-related [Anaeramoeba flamelloides]|uniref:Basic-leucine zipper transcription factor f-related n=1 Tax=Anaeramoeba flamelloides TaxID=1746091 RepID=A0AAV7ZRT7_9EUKA|nr:basic-leucine zipper transcription factor f-related [Anaeramoeba flamelloides]